MWVSQAVREWFQISRQAYEDLKVQNSSLQAQVIELKLKDREQTLWIDWLRHRHNILEAENKTLIEKAYQIKLPAPQMERYQPPVVEPMQFSFTDLGDELAQKLGIPIFGEPTDIS